MTENLSKYQVLIPNVDTHLIETLEDLQSKKILTVIRAYYNFPQVPEELNSILIELTVYRYNIIGSEGLKQEDKLGTDVYDMGYEDRLLDKCEIFAQNYSNHANNKWRIQFL